MFIIEIKAANESKLWINHDPTLTALDILSLISSWNAKIHRNNADFLKRKNEMVIIGPVHFLLEQKLQQLVSKANVHKSWWL
jgi:hypothetical protein